MISTFDVATPLWSQADIDALARTIASGVLTCKYSGPPSREETYQSLDAMRAQLAVMRAELARATGGAAPFRVAATNKGFRTTNGGQGGGVSGGGDF